MYTYDGLTFTGLSGSNSITVSSPISYITESPAGTATKLTKDPTVEGINPRLMFKFIKSKFKMNPKQEEWHRGRMRKLAKLINESKELNQTSMFEHLSQLLAIAVRESEMQSYFTTGTVQWIHKSDVLKYQPKVSGKCVFFKKIQEFPRPIPNNVALRIKKLQEHKIFDDIWILYLDYTKEEIKSNEKKIKEKDPIAFGSISYNPDILYYIDDWVDERCDLTLDKVVESLREGNKEFNLGELPEIDTDYVQKIKEEVLARHKRLAETSSANWREKEIEARIETEKREWQKKMELEEQEKAKKSILSKFKNLWRKS